MGLWHDITLWPPTYCLETGASMDNQEHDIDKCLCNQCKTDRYLAWLATAPIKEDKAVVYDYEKDEGYR